jgi:hypothetical protein
LRRETDTELALSFDPHTGANPPARPAWIGHSDIMRVTKVSRNCSFGDTRQRENGSAKVGHGSGVIISLRAA